MASAESPDKPKDLRLKELLAAASHDYALKSYDNASDLYAQAAELQDEINGEMNPANAELLYAYGRCLHHLAVSNSDVLGGKVAGPPDGAKKSGKKRKRGGDAVAGSSSAAASGIASDTMKRKEGALAEDILERIVEEREGMQFKEEEEKVKQQSKPLFQISGDDDGEQDEGTDSEDDEADEDAGDDEAEEQEDDFATAFEVLEVARVLLQRQIQDLNALKSTDKANQNTDDEVSKQIWAARDRLADAHDLQAEISLENERFADAVSDSRASLTLKQELHEETNGQIAEAHYKLSLALECGSVTIPKDENGMPIEGAPQKVDKAMREEAAKEMEAAIRTTRLRLDKETEAMKALSGAQLKTKQEEKKDVEEIIGDMEIKVRPVACTPQKSQRYPYADKVSIARRPAQSVRVGKQSFWARGRGARQQSLRWHPWPDAW